VRMIVLGIVVIVLGIALVAMGISDRSRAPVLTAADATRGAWRVTHEAMVSETGLAVLRAIEFKSYNISDATWGRVTLADIERERGDIQRTREWAGTLEDGPVKLAYLGWCQHYEDKLPEVETEIRTHARGEAERQTESHLRELAAAMPKPP
jgi:hypothetical protein